MISENSIAAAARLGELARNNPPEVVAQAIREQMKKQFILGGISALDALVGSVPAETLDLPEEQRQVIVTVLEVIESFTVKLREKL